MQSQKLTDVPRAQAESRLAVFFRSQGASLVERKTWARNFLAMAHHRSGLFVESEPGIYAFSIRTSVSTRSNEHREQLGGNRSLCVGARR